MEASYKRWFSEMAWILVLPGIRHFRSTGPVFVMRLYRLLLISTLALMLFIGGAILLGRRQPLPDAVAMLHLDMCAPPCWIGISPGVTTLDEAEHQLKKVFPESRYKVSDTPGGYTITDSKTDFAIDVMFGSADMV